LDGTMSTTNLMLIQVSTILEQHCCVLCCSFIMMVWQQALGSTSVFVVHYKIKARV